MGNDAMITILKVLRETERTCCIAIAVHNETPDFDGRRVNFHDDVAARQQTRCCDVAVAIRGDVTEVRVQFDVQRIGLVLRVTRVTRGTRVGSVIASGVAEVRGIRRQGFVRSV